MRRWLVPIAICGVIHLALVGLLFWLEKDGDGTRLWLNLAELALLTPLIVAQEFVHFAHSFTPLLIALVANSALYGLALGLLYGWAHPTPTVPGLCYACGYDLRGTPARGHCPECGVTL